MRVPQTFPSLILDGALGAFSQALILVLGRFAGAINSPDRGITAARPTAQLVIGQTYFDTTLGKPIWWRGAAWVDGAGTVV